MGFFWSAKKKNVGDDESSSDEDNVLTIQAFDNGEYENGQSLRLTPTECAERSDLGQVVCPKIDRPEDCSLYSAWGTRITSCNDLKNGDNVFVVPIGRLYMWPSYDVGHQASIRHIGMPVGKPIILETISQRPRVFRLLNFFSEFEAETLIQNALDETEDAFKLKRSSTGAVGYTVDSKRTSEGAFDTRSEVAMAIKRRSFDLLGIFPYDESFADGLQVLRYNQTAAYISHMDWIEPVGSEHDYDSGGEGTNRFATVLLYLTDVEEGGETVFPQAKPFQERELPDSEEEEEEAQPTSHFVTKKEAMAETALFLEGRNLSHLFAEGSWQRDMVAECRSRLAVRPRKAEAILFYSQLPDGSVDRLSLHGGCPVLQGQKWAGNLWVWNGPRNGYMVKNSDTGKLEKPTITSISASFESNDIIGAQLYWEDQVWEELSPNRPVKVNTFAGHKWNVRLDGDLLITWVIAADKASQRFVLSSADLPIHN